MAEVVVSRVCLVVAAPTIRRRIDRTRGGRSRRLGARWSRARIARRSGVPAAERIRSDSLDALPSVRQGADGEVHGRLYFASGPPTQAFTTIQLPPLFSVFEGIDIPAGQERYTVQDSFVIPIDVNAFSVGAHAHYLGKEMKLTATLPDDAVKTLLWIKDWDFSWQERYRFKDVVSLPKGTARRNGQLRQLGGEQAQSEPSSRARDLG